MANGDEARAEALERLLAFQGDLRLLMRDVNQYPWDSDHELVVLTPEKASNVLSRYLSGELTPAQVEDWADAIEVRDGIGFPPLFEALLRDLIFELANPLLTGPLSRDTAADWLARLRSPEPPTGG
jgi:hypothetical protein